MKPSEKDLRAILALDTPGKGCKNYSIKAGAGGGKTTLLSSRICKQIIAGTPIEEFVIITYTNAAAAELRDKISDRLAEAPFDERFRDMMIQTTEAVMSCGFRVVYAFTESDEISLLFDKDEDTFGRKVRKYNSTLAGEASAAISLALGRVATFDCRMVPLPTIERVQDYFRWRQEDANRNALNSHCYWMLRKEGRSVHEATKELEGKGVSYKNELLFARGINYDKLPSWQKRGIGMWNEQYEKEGYNPMTKETVAAVRSRIHVEYELPLGDAYAEMVAGFVKE